MTLLDSYAEDDVTVQMVLAASGASKGSLYHHYRDFDSLLDQAQATRYAASVDATVEGILAIDDIVAALTSLAACTVAPSDQVRVQLLAIAARRPSLQRLVAPEQQRLTDSIAALVRAAQAQGRMRPDVDPGVVALVVQACAAGHVVAGVAHRGPIAWEDALATVLGALLLPASAAADGSDPLASV